MKYDFHITNTFKKKRNLKLRQTSFIPSTLPEPLITCVQLEQEGAKQRGLCKAHLDRTQGYLRVCPF